MQHQPVYARNAICRVTILTTVQFKPTSFLYVLQVTIQRDKPMSTHLPPTNVAGTNNNIIDCENGPNLTHTLT